MHEQKFKDLLSSTCQISPERIVLDLELEAKVLFPLGVTFFTGFFCFSVVKPLMPIYALLPTLFNYEKPRLECFLVFLIIFSLGDDMLLLLWHKLKTQNWFANGFLRTSFIQQGGYMNNEQDDLLRQVISNYL